MRTSINGFPRREKNRQEVFRILTPHFMEAFMRTDVASDILPENARLFEAGKEVDSDDETDAFGARRRNYE